MSEPPSGTVTFFFTDIEGSSQLWEQYPQQMPAALARHDAIVREAIEVNRGHIFKAVGDGFRAAFTSPTGALEAAVQTQKRLTSEDWQVAFDVPSSALQVRIALHTGVAHSQEGDYYGPPVNRTARLLSSGHGGQSLLSLATEELIRDSLPAGVLLRDLGAHYLEDLQRSERIFQIEIPGLPADFPPLRTVHTRRNNLPPQATPLIGREKEIDEAARILRHADTHLLTLKGPGGIGKTRLGLQIVTDLANEFRDGAFLVNLAPVRDHARVMPAIAQAVGVREAGGQPIFDTLREYLKDKHLLLLLDNFEQVTGAALQINTLLRAAPGLKVVVTSRVALQVQGEREYPVPPLSLPDTGHLPRLEQLTNYEAVRLFVERAQAVRPAFQLVEDNARPVAEICHRLDGLPLAIELAAARSKLLPPQAILSRLDSRLKLLTGGARDVAARQQTLRGTIDWSYELLEEPNRQLFTRMAVFHGGNTLAAIDRLYESDLPLKTNTLDAVEALLTGSLLQQREGSDGESRFSMLETIHEYANEKLEQSGEQSTLRRLHALYFMSLAEEAEPHLTGVTQREWLDRLDDEHDNMRAALRWAGEERTPESVEIGLRIGAAIWRLWHTRGYLAEGKEHILKLLSISEEWSVAKREETAALAGSVEVSTLKAKAGALNGAGQLCVMQGDFESARSLFERALKLGREIGEERTIARSLNFLGSVYLSDGNYARARDFYEESLAIHRKIGETRGVASALNGLGHVAVSEADYATARSRYEGCLLIVRNLGDRGATALSLNALGLVASIQGDYQTAKSMYEGCLEIMTELRDRNGTSWSLFSLGSLAYVAGNYGRARALYDESLSIRREVGDKSGIAWSLDGLGHVALVEGDYPLARSFHEESLAIRREIAEKWGIAHSLLSFGALALAEQGYQAARSFYSEALAAHQDLGNKSGIASALGGLGSVAYMHQEYKEACTLYRESLLIRQATGERWGIAAALAGIGAALVEMGSPGAGLQLMGYVDALLAIMDARLEPAESNIYRLGISTARAYFGERIEATLQEGRAMTNDEALRFALEHTKGLDGKSATARDGNWNLPPA